jgi:hypothetical protein
MAGHRSLLKHPRKALGQEGVQLRKLFVAESFEECPRIEP